MFLRFRLFFAFCFSVVFAQGAGIIYERFCSTCGLGGIDTIVSESGQFIIHRTQDPIFPPVVRQGETPLVEAEPQLVAVTAERIRREFMDELGLPNFFRDKVHVVILPRAKPGDPVQLVSHVHVNGFVYQLGVPAYLESEKLLKGLVQVILQEYANRSGSRNAELPTWLVEGMMRQLLSSVLPAPVLNRTPLTVERIGYDRLGYTRTFLQTNAPLTIQELSFNNLPALSPLERVRYEDSAHLLVHELLRLRNGSFLMSRFLANLPGALNWQTAFYAAYQQYFHTPLDLEKWWMLRCVELTSRKQHQAWSTATSLDRLDSLLRITTETRERTNAIPQRSEIRFQQVLTNFDFGMQKDIFGRKLQEIFFTSPSFSPEVAPLAAAYEQAIETYLEKRALNDYQPGLKSDPEQRVQFLLKSTSRNFDELDHAAQEIREGRKPKLPEVPRRTAGRQVLVTQGTNVK